MHTLSSSRLPRTVLLLVLAVALAVAVAVIGSRSPAAAQAPGTQTLTLTELEKGSTFTHIRNTKTKHRRANLRGDQDVFTNPLADASGRIVGKLHVGCVTTVGSADFMRSKLNCSGVYVLSGGTLTAQGIFIPGDEQSAIAITGGTGTYAGARGSIVSVAAKGGSKDTITLLGA